MSYYQRERRQELRLGAPGNGRVGKHRPLEQRRAKFMKRRGVSSIAAALTTAETGIKRYFARGTNLPETWRRARGRTRSIRKHQTLFAIHAARLEGLACV